MRTTQSDIMLFSSLDYMESLGQTVWQRPHEMQLKASIIGSPDSFFLGMTIAFTGHTLTHFLHLIQVGTVILLPKNDNQEKQPNRIL